uniref:Major facilitator superfamily (MFS) profile domain-containing protein n=1 Tax=Globodera rostochiensis TaxID=31243 RepID=A0A914HWU0_GLORO
MACISSNMIALNFTQILMRRTNWENASFPTNSPILVNTSDVHLEEDVLPVLVLNSSHVVPPTVPYSAREKSMLLYAVGLASIVSTFPFSAMYTRFGARLVFFGAGITSAVATALLPLAAAHGMVAFLIVRFFQGLSYGSVFAAIGYVCHRWASLREHGLFLSFMTCFTSLSVAMTNYLAAYISSTPSLGWPWVYYALAFVTLAPFVLWLFLYTDHPETHKFVGLSERKIILMDKTEAEIVHDGNMPYRKILSTKIVYVIWFNAFADIVSAVFLITYLPTYVSKVLGYGVRETGIWSSFPAIVQLPLRVFFGILADRISCASELNKMRVFNTIALVLSGLFFALVGFVPDHLPFVAIIVMTLNLAAVACNTGGFYKCGTLVTRQYAHFVVAGIQFEKSVTLFVAPILYAIFITDESSRGQWRVLFIGMAVVLFIANAFFVAMATDQPAKFTKAQSKGEENGSGQMDDNPQKCYEMSNKHIL